MMNKRLITLPVLTTICSIMAMAATRTDAQMRLTAQQVLMQCDTPIECVMHDSGVAIFCRQSGGFVIESDNERLPTVLAYSTTAKLDKTTQNPGFNWWLRAVKQISANGEARHERTTPDPGKYATRVDSLLTTLWGQREPFKFMCPFDTYFDSRELDGTYQPDSGHFVAGCVAVAMAQYMNYYKYPKHGTGQDSIVVKYETPAAEVTYRVDFEQATYDWANMIDDYRDDYTSQQGVAVAQLCYHAGVAAHTTYNRYGGGSTDPDCLRAMREHFGYNDTAHYIVRSRYSEPEWMEMVYNELSNRRPILYSGRDLNLEAGIIGAHNFIIDGYDEQGLVHVNWGWYGLENGFFDIALLNPRQYSYDEWQAMYVGLYPAYKTKYGDVNGDGIVDISDVNEIVNAMLHDNSINKHCDIDGDGSIDITDVNEVINIMLEQ